MKKFLLPIFLLIGIITISMSFEIGLNPTFSLDKNWNEVNFKINHFSDNFDFIADLSALNDGKYKPSQSEDYYFGYYFLMNEGGINLHFEDIDFSFGNLKHSDLIDSPYSVFISSANNSSNIMDLKYENDKIFYETRWIGLNHNSNVVLSYATDTTYPERGANFKTYGFKFGNFRFAYEESAVYYDEYFSMDYFANPIPNFFIQYTTMSSGKPWSHGNNANAIMGFMLDYKDNEKYIYSQILVDDINMNRFLKPDGTQNPDKLAWTFGSDFYTEYGKFGFNHGGATKYTFSPVSLSTPYGYTYYPDVVYDYDGYKPISAKDNYIGYIHGENNLSFMMDYYNQFAEDLDYSASVEYSITGSQSPIDPWHEDSNYEQGTHLLDGDEYLEHSLIFKNNINMSFRHFDLGFGFSIGQIKNKLDLFLITDTNRYMFKPNPDLDENIFSFNFKITTNFSF